LISDKYGIIAPLKKNQLRLCQF